MSEFWDCRWPDPVALQVAQERLLHERDPNHNRVDINRNIAIRVHMENRSGWTGITQALLATPWGVERIYWSDPALSEPPIHAACDLAFDATGRVESGQGVLLEVDEDERKPVLIIWEPETGHVFAETLLTANEVVTCSSTEEALAAVMGNTDTPQKYSVSEHLHHTVTRRSFLGIF